jgi:hypothetical protein
MAISLTFVGAAQVAQLAASRPLLLRHVVLALVFPHAWRMLASFVRGPDLVMAPFIIRDVVSLNIALLVFWTAVLLSRHLISP